MASPEVVDLAALLVPIPGEKPAGLDLRADSTPGSEYYAIRDARKLASETERRIDKGEDTDAEGKKIQPPEWRPVLEGARKAIAQKSKDLEIAAYLTEALVRLKGFAGIRDGYRLARGLVEQFWDGLYPVSTDGEIITDRFSHILHLNGIEDPGTLIVPVRKIPMTTATSAGTFNLTHLQQARSLEQIKDAKVRQKRIEEGAITLETIQRAVAETPASFYAVLVEDIGQAAEDFRGFCGALGERSGFDPPSSYLLGVIDEYLDTIKDLARDKLPKAPVPATSTAEPGQPAAAATAAALPADPGAIRDRNDALDRLRKVADYFREHEPQSVIPYALEQVVNWGKMSLPDLLAELIPDEGPRKSVFKQVGIRPPETKK